MARTWMLVVVLALLLPCAATAQEGCVQPSPPELLERYVGRTAWEPVWQWKNLSTPDRPIRYKYWFSFFTPTNGQYSQGPFEDAGFMVIPQLVPVGSTIHFTVFAQSICGESEWSRDFVVIGMPPPPRPPNLDARYAGKEIVTTTPSWSWTHWTEDIPRKFIHWGQAENWADIRLTGPEGLVETREILGFMQFKPAAPLPNGTYQLELRTKVHFVGLAPPVYTDWVKDTVVVNHPVQAPEFVTSFNGQEGSATPTWSWRRNRLGAQPQHYVVRMSWKDEEEPVPGTSWQPKAPIPAGLHKISLRAERGTAKSGEVEDWIRVVPYPLKPELIECFRYGGRWTTELRPTWAWHPGPASQGILDYTVSIQKDGGTPQVQQLAKDQTVWRPAADLSPGRYTFSIRARNTAGTGEEATDRVEVVLAAPQKVTLEFAATVTAVSEDTQGAKVEVRLVTSDKTRTLTKVKVRCLYEGVTATAGKDFNDTAVPIEFEAGTLNEATKACPIPILQDEVLESPERFAVVLASAEEAQLGSPARHEVILVDDELAVPAGGKAGVEITPSTGSTSEAGGSVTFAVTLKSPSGSEVRVALASTDTSEGQVDTEALVFKAGETAKTFKVTGQDDKIADRNQLYRIRTFVQSDDPLYARIDPLDPILTNQDDETLAYVVEPSGDLTVREGDLPLKLKISLTGPPPATLSDVPVTLSSNRATVKPDKLFFDKDSWKDRVVEVSVANNQKADPVSSLQVVVGKAGEKPDPLQVNVRILDNEPQGFVLDPEPTGEIDLAEGGGSKSYNVRLADPPGGDLVLEATSSDPRVQAVLGKTSVKPEDWKNGISLVVSAPANTADEEDVSVLVTLEARGDGAPAPRILRFRRKDDDATAYVVEPADGLTLRERGSAKLKVSLTGPPAGTVTVPVTSGSSRVKVNPPSLTLDKKSWRDLEVVVSVENDDQVYPEQSVAIEVGKGDNGAWAVTGIAPVSVNVRVQDDDPLQIVFSPDTSSAETALDEGGSKTYSVRLSGPAAGTLRLKATSSDPRVVAMLGKERPEPGDWPSGISLTVSNPSNTADEPDFPAVVVLEAEGTGAPAARILRFLRKDDDQAQGLLLSPDPAGEVTLKEKTSTSYKLRLGAEPAGTIKVSFTVSEPRFGKVEAVGTSTLSSANWSQGIEFKITALDNDSDGDDVPFAVTLTTEPALPSRVLLFRHQDDDPPRLWLDPLEDLQLTEGECPQHFTITLSSAPSQPVTLPLSANSDRISLEPPSLSLNAANWWKTHWVQVSAKDDSWDSGEEESVSVWIGAQGDPLRREVTVDLIEDDEAAIRIEPLEVRADEPGATGEFTVSLSTASKAEVRFSLFAEPLSGLTFSENPVVLPAGTLEKKVKVFTVNDPDPDSEQSFRFYVRPAETTDPEYYTAKLNRDYVDVRSANDDLKVIVLDPEPAVPVRLPFAGGKDAIQVRLGSRPAQSVQVTVTPSSGAVAASPSRLTFDRNNWDKTAKVSLTTTGTPGSSPEDQAVEVKLEAPGLTSRSVPILLTSDGAGFEVIPTEGVIAFQSAGPGRFQVRLRSRPTDPVTIPVSASRPDEALLSTPSLTFTADNWKAFQEVRVGGRHKPAGDPPTVHTILLGPADSRDPRYSRLDLPDVRVTSLEVFSFEVTPRSGLTTTEGGGVARFNVAMPFQPRADVRIPLAVSDPAEGTVTPRELVFTPRDWDIPRTVQVAGVDDEAVDGPKTFSVLVGPVQSEDTVNGWELPSVRVTNLDDDVEAEGTAGGGFYTVFPCRLLDTRQEGTPLRKGDVRVLTVHGRCGVPPEAKAVAVGITTASATAAGWMGFFPGDKQPSGTSVVAFKPGANRGGSAFLALSGDGKGTLAASADLPAGQSVHLIVDVVGWFD